MERETTGRTKRGLKNLKCELKLEKLKMKRGSKLEPEDEMTESRPDFKVGSEKKEDLESTSCNLNLEKVCFGIIHICIFS